MKRYTVTKILCIFSRHAYKKRVPKVHNELQKPFSTADRGTRTLTRSPPADFESAASAIPPHPRVVITS